MQGPDRHLVAFYYNYKHVRLRRGSFREVVGLGAKEMALLSKHKADLSHLTSPHPLHWHPSYRRRKGEICDGAALVLGESHQTQRNHGRWLTRDNPVPLPLISLLLLVGKERVRRAAPCHQRH